MCVRKGGPDNKVRGAKLGPPCWPHGLCYLGGIHKCSTYFLCSCLQRFIFRYTRTKYRLRYIAFKYFKRCFALTKTVWIKNRFFTAQYKEGVLLVLIAISLHQNLLLASIPLGQHYIYSRFSHSVWRSISRKLPFTRRILSNYDWSSYDLIHRLIAYGRIWARNWNKIRNEAYLIFLR